MLDREHIIARALSYGFPEQLIERTLKPCECGGYYCRGWQFTSAEWRKEDFEIGNRARRGKG